LDYKVYTLVYCKSHNKRPVYETKAKHQEILHVISESVNPDDISYAKYKEMFVNAINDILEILDKMHKQM
jgi:hypothetical protein